MTCQVCKAGTDNIEPLSSVNFPICRPCVETEVIEIAERKAKEANEIIQSNENQRGRSYQMKCFMKDIITQMVMSQEHNA